MMKRGTSAVAAALIAVLAFAGTATAQTDHLRYKTAKKLAKQLAKQQVGDRDVVAQHIYDAERLNRRAIAFSYDDRTSDDVFCTAVLLVRQRRISRDGDVRITARFRGQECAKVPDDALAIEAAIRATARVLRDLKDETEASFQRLLRSSARCEDLRVPRHRRAHARAILDIALAEALFRPNEVALLDFATHLAEIDTANQVLRRGIGAWADWYLAVQALPDITDPCATLRAWARADWAASEAPIHLARYRRIHRRMHADERVLERTARHLRDLGVLPRLARRFTLAGAINVAVVDAPGAPAPRKIALP